MTKRSSIPSKPRHVLIYDEDWEFLMHHYGPYSDSRLGVSNAIREIIHSKVRELRARADALRDKDNQDKDAAAA